MQNKAIKEKQKRKGLLFVIFRGIAKLFYGKRKHVGLQNIPQEPCIIVGNHAQLHGSLTAELVYPYKKYTWCIGDLMHLKEAPAYAFKDFWSSKPARTHKFYKAMSYVVSPLLVYIHNNADVIGVYKDMRGISTFKNSVKALKQGAHIILYPEYHKPYNNIVNEFQTKFVDLARLYYKDTGTELSFVPMYIAPKLKTIVYGEPIKYNGAEPIEQQRTTICEYLKTEITNIAQQLPVHTVIPYENISKKDYPKSK